MEQEMRAHLTRESSINGLTNAFFNGLIAWWLMKSREVIPIWGADGLAVDFTATAFILVLIVSYIVIPLQRRKARSQPRADYPWPADGCYHRVIMALPHSLGQAALLLALIAVLLFVPPALGILHYLRIDSFDPTSFALVKGLWAGVMAACMVIPMVGLAQVMAGLTRDNKTGGDE